MSGANAKVNTVSKDVIEEVKNDKIGSWRAGWNVSNCILSISILNEPYAVLQSGICGFVFTVISGLCTCYTSVILRYCLYEEDEYGIPVKTFHSYAEIGQRAFNSKFGDILINTLMLVQAFLCGSYFILQAAVLIHECFDIQGLSVYLWLLIFTIVSLPYAFLHSLKGVSQISLIGNITQTILILIIMFYCLMNIHNWEIKNLQGDMKVWPFTQSLTVILISFCSTYYAPLIDASMSDLNKYNCMMIWTHAISTVLKLLICGAVILMWGTKTKDTFTNNLPTWPYVFITNPILAIRSLTNLPNPYFLIVALVESNIYKYLGPKQEMNENTALYKSVNQIKNHPCFDEEGYLKTWALALRFSILLLMVILTFCIPFLEILLGFLSCISGIPLLVILPCFCHLRLKKKTFYKYKMINILLIVFGSALSIFGFIANVIIMCQSN